MRRVAVLSRLSVATLLALTLAACDPPTITHQETKTPTFAHNVTFTLNLNTGSITAHLTTGVPPGGTTGSMDANNLNSGQFSQYSHAASCQIDGSTTELTLQTDAGCKKILTKAKDWSHWAE
jgi:hypothetical protein